MQPRRQATLTQPLHCVLQTCTYLSTWQHQMTTIMQPFQCDLQPEIQETHRTTHTGTTTRCRTQGRNQNDPSRNHRTHEVPFIAGRSHFTRKNTSFVLPPQNKAHATFMQPFQGDLQPQIQETHRTTHTGTTTRCRTQRRKPDSRILVSDSRGFWFLIRGILVSDSRILVSDSKVLVSDSQFLIRAVLYPIPIF